MNREPVFARHGVPQTNLKSAAVLTCLAAPVPLDAFRPSYSDTTARIYRASDLQRELLPKLKRVPTTPDLPTWERIFERPGSIIQADGAAAKSIRQTICRSIHVKPQEQYLLFP